MCPTRPDSRPASRDEPPSGRDDDVVWTVVLAGGSGRRFGGPKQYELLGDRRIVDISVATARAAGHGVVLVVPPDDVEREAGVAGGPTRSDSVRAGLSAGPADASVICVHDAARPFASPSVYAAVIGAVRAGSDGAVPGVPVTDTIKQVDSSGVVVTTLPRDELVAVQTPQAFVASVLRAAAAGEGSDCASLVESAGGRVKVVAGDERLAKVTTAADLARVAGWL
jgi:2-C-methyl-D-erythritol 4-phosphate cytidylyltransferase